MLRKTKFLSLIVSACILNSLSVYGMVKDEFDLFKYNLRKWRVLDQGPMGATLLYQDKIKSISPKFTEVQISCNSQGLYSIWITSNNSVQETPKFNVENFESGSWEIDNQSSFNQKIRSKLSNRATFDIFPAEGNFDKTYKKYEREFDTIQRNAFELNMGKNNRYVISAEHLKLGIPMHLIVEKCSPLFNVYHSNKQVEKRQKKVEFIKQMEISKIEEEKRLGYHSLFQNASAQFGISDIIEMVIEGKLNLEEYRESFFKVSNNDTYKVAQVLGDRIILSNFNYSSPAKTYVLLTGKPNNMVLEGMTAGQFSKVVIYKGIQQLTTRTDATIRVIHFDIIE